MCRTTSADELLMAHAAGQLPEPVSLIVATHLALSPAARRRYRRHEAIGGALLEELAPAPVAEGAWDRLLARLDEASDRPHKAAEPSGSRLPLPLRDYLPAPFDALPWRSYGVVAEVELPVKAPGYRTVLVRVGAGRVVPRHTHEGTELTLVLEGAFRDETGHYCRGDLAIADRTLDHRPMADAGQDCLCLTVADGPLRLTGPFGRMLNPFIRAWAGGISGGKGRLQK